jgi:hypothetical protein
MVSGHLRFSLGLGVDVENGETEAVEVCRPSLLSHHWTT